MRLSTLFPTPRIRPSRALGLSLGLGMTALAIGCTANTSGANMASASNSPAAVLVTMPASAKSAALPMVTDAVTGEQLTPPMAGAVLLATDPTRPGVKTWKTPTGQVLVQMPKDRGHCATRMPDGQLAVGDCPLATTPTPAAPGATTP